jgi:adenosine deaminase
MQDWRSFKKTELHRHLEGAVRLQTILDVAFEAGVKLPSGVLDAATLAHHACVLAPVKDLATMLGKMGIMQSVLATSQILERVAFEACEDAYNDGIFLLELRYSPGFIKIGHPGLTFDVIHEAIVTGVKRAEKKYIGKLSVGLIGIITREQPLSEARDTTEFIITNRDTFVGLDLAGDEAGFDCKNFETFFTRAKSMSLGITVHAGEARTHYSAQSVRDSIERLQASRIGHGIQIIHDAEILDFVIKNDVTLEVCPTSNVYTGAVDSLKAHPIRKLLESGVSLTLNSDDPTFFGIDLTHEYEILTRHLNFGEKEFNLMNATALKKTFIKNLALY